jgi:DNA-binding response OmpR family regulator
VQSVSNSNEAIRSFEEGDFQEVVAGVNVPAASALTYLQLFKLKRPSIQILVLSGFTAMENDAAAFWFGADDLLEKPFEAETLRARITHWI